MTDRQITHAPGCWDWGPRHYGCALREIEALRAEVKRLKSMTAVTMGVGSGDGNLFVHGDCESIKAAQAIVLERGALRAEVERLAMALRRYGVHDQACSAMDIPICTCGLDAALQPQPKQEPTT